MRNVPATMLRLLPLFLLTLPVHADEARPAAGSPFRLVVPTDKEPSRALRQVQRLEVLDLGKRATPAR